MPTSTCTVLVPSSALIAAWWYYYYCSALSSVGDYYHLATSTTHAQAGRAPAAVLVSNTGCALPGGGPAMRQPEWWCLAERSLPPPHTACWRALLRPPPPFPQPPSLLRAVRALARGAASCMAAGCCPLLVVAGYAGTGCAGTRPASD